MRKLNILIVLLASFYCKSQSLEKQLISNSGQQFSNSENVVEWSLGEVVINYQSTSNLSVTSGFHYFKIQQANNLENLSYDSFRIFPNPTSGKLTLETNSEDSYKLICYDFKGSELASFELNQFLTNLDLTYLPPGSYSIKLENLKTKKATNYLFIKI